MARSLSACTLTKAYPNLGVQTDVSSPESCDAMVARAVDSHGKLDILINCAGVVGTPLMLSVLASVRTVVAVCSLALKRLLLVCPAGPTGKKITNVSVEEFDKTIAVNLRGSFNVTKSALLAMEKNDYGRILLIASIAGKEGNAGMTAFVSPMASIPAPLNS